MAPEQRQTRAELAARALYERIQAGEWSVGEKLPSENELAQELGVGRSSLREAIRMLSARGILHSRRGSGLYLTALEDAGNHQLSDQLSDLASAIEVRIALEVEAAELAARRRTNQELTELSAALARLNAARSESVDQLVAAEIAFHRAAVAASHNPVLLWLYDQFAPVMARSIYDTQRQFGPRDYGEFGDPHELMVEQIAARDSASVSRTLRSHLETLLRRIHRSG